MKGPQQELESAIGQVQRWGVALSSAMIAVGVILEVLRNARAVEVIQAGVLLLIATPWLRVTLSLGMFLRLRDWFYVGVCAFLLATMIAGLLTS